MRRFGTISLVVCLTLISGCRYCCWGKRASEKQCPTDVRKTHFWCFGEDAIFHYPCGPKEEFYGYQPTCWREWPTSGAAWRDLYCRPTEASAHQTVEVMPAPGTGPAILPDAELPDPVQNVPPTPVPPLVPPQSPPAEGNRGPSSLDFLPPNDNGATKLPGFEPPSGNAPTTLPGFDQPGSNTPTTLPEFDQPGSNAPGALPGFEQSSDNAPTTLPSAEPAGGNAPATLPGFEQPGGNAPATLPGFEQSSGKAPTTLPSAEPAGGNVPMTLPGFEPPSVSRPTKLPGFEHPEPSQRVAPMSNEPAEPHELPASEDDSEQLLKNYTWQQGRRELEQTSHLRSAQGVEPAYYRAQGESQRITPERRTSLEIRRLPPI